MSTEETNALARDDSGYAALLTDLRAIISAGRGRAAAAVNAEVLVLQRRI
jgi:hypothetical protein